MRKLAVLALLLAVFVLLVGNFSLNPQYIQHGERPLVVWYVVAKRLGDDFIEKASQYKPDIVLLSVYAEDDVLPLNGSKDFDLSGLVRDLQNLGVEVYYSFSLFSRSAKSREEYDKLKDAGIPYSEQKIHMADFSAHLRENDPDRYHELFDYYFENGLNPEEIPHVLRKPIEGFYIPPGHYTAIDPLYRPYQQFMVKVINETIQKARPDGLAFDHIRFFTFDEGYNKDIRDWIMDRFGLDVWNYTPKPIFQLNASGWSEEDRTYYNARAKLIEEAVKNITSEFPGFKLFGTTMGVTEPARANGQYAELQGNVFDALLLMAYDRDSSEVARNVNATATESGKDVILGIFPFENDVAIKNINAGLTAGASGIYLLGYDFSDEVHKYLLDIRNIN